MDDELTTDVAPEVVPLEEETPALPAQAEPEPPEPEAQPSSQPIDLDEIAERAAQRLEPKLLERMESRQRESERRSHQSIRDTIRAQFQQVYQQQARLIDELVTAGDLDPGKALERKVALRDKVEQQAYEEETRRAQLEAQQPQRQVTEQQAKREWNETWFKALEDYDLDDRDPEVRELRENFQVTAQDFESAKSQMRRAVKKAAQKKGERMQQGQRQQTQDAKKAEREAEEKRKAAQAKAVNVDTGGGTVAGVAKGKEALTAELNKLEKQSLAGLSSEERRERRERMMAIADDLEKLGD